MGVCKKRTIKIAKTIARALTPAGVRLIGDIVGIVASTDWANSEKRKNAVDMASGALKVRGIEARESIIRAAVEASVVALKDGAEALAELGAADEDDVVEIEAEE
jgi:hypothetical protein